MARAEAQALVAAQPEASAAEMAEAMPEVGRGEERPVALPDLAAESVAGVMGVESEVDRPAERPAAE